VVVVEQDEVKQLANGKTRLRNSCGHEFDYVIKKSSAVKWLQGRPCPSCARKNPNKNPSSPKPPKREDIVKEQEQKQDNPTPETVVEETPEPVVEQTVSQEDVDAVLATFPKVPDTLHHNKMADLMLLLQWDIPVWLQGPPGTSKSTLAQQAADALELSFHSMQCHEMMTDSSLFGYRDAQGVMHRTPFREAYENGGVFLLDEVDNGNPNLLAALNSALANGHCVFAGDLVSRHPDFRCVATANTAGLGPEHGFIGRNGVDLATRDRFATIFVAIDRNLELGVAKLAANEDNSAETNAAQRVTEKNLENRARNACIAPNVETVLASVEKLRTLVEERYRGSVVSPRTTMHAGSMVRAGFTLAEALGAKLPGITGSDLDSLLRSVV